MQEQIILVDKNNNSIGQCEKLKAHREGKLHRAFSIFVFNSSNELLLQQRSNSKYHSPCLWSNTCCSHPNPKEPLQQSIQNRLKHEMGFNCELKKIFSFMYKVEFKNIELYEHEFDHVFIGIYNGKVKVNPDEVKRYKWICMEKLLEDIKTNSNKYTYWFKESINKVINFL